MRCVFLLMLDDVDVQIVTSFAVSNTHFLPLDPTNVKAKGKYDIAYYSLYTAGDIPCIIT